MKHTISLQEAIIMTRRYRQYRADITNPAYAARNLLPLSETFSREALEGLLAQPCCTSIRIYYGLDPNFQLHAILVACDKNNADILPDPDKTDDGTLVDRGNRCPPLCPGAGPLNE